MNDQTLRRIMVVEDDEDVMVVLEVSLRTIGGFEIQSHRCGADALDAIDAFDPQLLVADVMMPEMDGPELLRRLRRRGCEVPVVFLTAKGESDRQRLQLTDCLAVLGKPFQPTKLAAQLREIWAANRA